MQAPVESGDVRNEENGAAGGRLTPSRHARKSAHTHTAGGQETERHGKVNRTPPAPWTGASADETINNSRGTRLVCAPPALSPFPVPPTSLPLARSGSPSLFTPTSPPLISSLFACPRKEPGGNGVSAAGLEPDRPRSSPEAAVRAQELRIGAQDPRVRADVHVDDCFYLDILQSSSSAAVICNRRSIRGTV